MKQSEAQSQPVVITSRQWIKRFVQVGLSMLSVAAFPALATEWTVQMLNYNDSESMVFKPAVIHANIGDTVVFEPTHSGHYVQSFITPDGSGRWRTGMDEKTTLKLDTEGLYVYYCPPHLMMGMVGMIQVGRATNLKKVTENLPRLKAKAHLKPQRVEALLDNVSHH